MSNKPTHEVYVVVDPTAGQGEAAKPRWTKIGVGFSKNDSMTLLLDAAPLQNRLVIRPTKTVAAVKGGPK